MHGWSAVSFFPATHQRVRVIAKDHRGVYEVDFLCRFANGEWRNAKTGKLIEARVLFWTADAKLEALDDDFKIMLKLDPELNSKAAFVKNIAVPSVPTQSMKTQLAKTQFGGALLLAQENRKENLRKMLRSKLLKKENA